MNGTWASWPRSYNPATVPGLMCRYLLSVSWDGRLYDCDFNQALDLPLKEGLPQTLRDFDLPTLAARQIHLGDHCYEPHRGRRLLLCGGKLVGE